ncbi:VENN motif pre-toxin domain-containing protein [Gallibacterium anatis]|uniref:VENN motif pre-toxin domain-containing protein n=1 Tax=Gallibacterium anatis TaxID=750 RepID=UPI0038D44B6F
MTESTLVAISAGLSALGNIQKSDSTTTHSAIGSNINLTTQQGDVPTALARDTKAANEQVDKTEIADLKTRQEMAQVIGEIANNGITIVLKPKLDEAERQKAEAEAILKNDANNQAAKQQLETANKTIKDYGQGSQIQLAVRAVTGVLQGIATGEATQAAVGGLSPYANYAIKKATTDKAGNVNTEANLMAHALLGAVEAYATGNNATAGAAGAVGGELAAKIITEQLYQKTPEQLTEAQKQTVTALSQLASGLAGGLISDSTADAINAAEIGKRAVEDNNLATATGKKAFPIVRNIICTQKCVDALTALGLSSALILSQSEIEEAINAGIDPSKIARLSDEQRRYINEQILSNPNSHLFLGNKVWIPNADGGFTPVDPSLVTTTYGGKQIIDPRILITHTGGIQYPADYELPTHTGGEQLSGEIKGSHILPGSEIQVGDWKDNLLEARNKDTINAASNLGFDILPALKDGDSYQLPRFLRGLLSVGSCC